MTEQHETFWKPEVKTGASAGIAFHASHAATVMMSLNRIKKWKVLQYHDIQMTWTIR